MTRKSDLQKEIDKYAAIARVELLKFHNSGSFEMGLTSVPTKHQGPFKEYYKFLAELIYPGMQVLEIGSGTGLHTAVAVELGADITALDVSKDSLDVLDLRFHGAVKTLCADMVSIPVADNTFDLVISCGSLSYGKPNEVFNEVMRLLKPGGSIVFLDTLNHNWIYCLNRFRHYLQGKRTFSTLKWMPRLKIIRKYEARFASSAVRYYGKVLWLHGPLGIAFSPIFVNKILEQIDDSRFLSRSAFKFLLVCKNLQK
jgi:ubiquinone/menaquinone biosynthesis C-methylase UbiE